MLVSIVIPTRNRDAVVGRAVRSALAQHGEIEIVVVDDGSDDGTPGVIASIDDERVRYLRTDHHGVARARNAGARMAHGELLAFLDDDDELDPRWADVLRGRIGRDDAVAVACCGVRRRDAGQTREVEVRPGDHGLSYRGVGVTFNTGAYVVRRAVFDEAGGFDEELASYQHSELALRLFDVLDRRGARIDSVDEPLVTVHRSGALQRLRNHPRRLHDSALTIVDRHHARLEASPAVLADYLAIAGVAAARLGDGRETRRLLARSLRTKPSPQRAGRYVLALVPPLGRRVWDVDTWQAAAEGLRDVDPKSDVGAG